MAFGIDLSRATEQSKNWGTRAEEYLKSVGGPGMIDSAHTHYGHEGVQEVIRHAPVAKPQPAPKKTAFNDHYQGGHDNMAHKNQDMMAQWAAARSLMA